MSAMPIFCVYVTMPSSEVAKNIARLIVTERLASCCTMLGTAQSIYWWQGKLEETEEVVCFFKTPQSKYQEFEKRLCELHSYEVPCIVALPITQGLPAFLQWVHSETLPD